jgi:beta-lactamase regulating signal transducer with metallopeptidase domain
MHVEAMARAIYSCVQVSLILSVALAATLMMRRASASARHWIWICALAAAALSPLSAKYLPKWEIETSARLEHIASLESLLNWSAAGSEMKMTAGKARSAISGSPPARASVFDSYWLVTAIWATGTTAVFVYMLLGTVASRRIRRSSQALSGKRLVELRWLAGLHDVRRPIGIATSDMTSSPLVSGIWYPVIILPHSSSAWSSDRIRVVLLHELAHIKRGDCITQVMARLVCAAYWFNPLVWIAVRRMRVEQERACDDFVLAAGTRASAYASHLCAIARTARHTRVSPIAAATLAMAQRSSIESRLMSILDPAVRRSADYGARVAGSSMILMASLALCTLNLRPAIATPAMANATNTANSRVAGRLIEAAHEGRIDEVQQLLDQGADLDAVSDGWSALVAAAHQGRMNTVRLLLDRGADVNAESDGWTALVAAAHQGHENTVSLLLDRGADMNAAPDGRTALDVASQQERREVVELLVERGADLGARSSARAERRRHP